MMLPGSAARMDHMRYPFFLLALVAAPLLAQVPMLKALQGHAAGKWTVTPIGSGEAQSLCLADAGPMLTGGRPAAQCSFTPLEDGDTTGTVNFRCEGSVSGRTTICLLYTSDAADDM
jgi:hypothetical protein